MNITLRTSTGELVKNVEILPFNDYPDVVVWGIRVFQRKSPPNYYECFCYVIPEIAPHQQLRTNDQ